MKKTILFILGFILFFSSCTDSGINIQGSVDKDIYEGKTVYVYTFVGDEYDVPKLLATTTVNNHSFAFENLDANEFVSAKELPAMAHLAFRDILDENRQQSANQYLPVAALILENGNIEVKFVGTSVQLSGTARNDKFNKLHQVITDIVTLADEVGELGSVDDIPANKEGKDGRAQFQEMNDKLKDLTFNFTKENISNNVGQFLFLKSYMDNIYTPTQMLTLIDQSTPEFQEREEVEELRTMLSQMNDGFPTSFEELDFEDIEIIE